MDSINASQPEQNRADLRGEKALDQIRTIVEKAETCFFCTNGSAGSAGARPMAVRKIDAEGNLWFLSASDSHKNREIAADPSVKLFFQGSQNSDFLYLDGRAEIKTDKALIKDLWSPILKTWFTEGIDDPRITVLKVTPTDGYYWDTKHGNAVAGVKMLVGAMIGKTLDDSIEGKVRM